MVPAAPLPTVCPAMCAPSGAGASGQLSMDKMVPVRSESFDFAVPLDLTFII